MKKVQVGIDLGTTNTLACCRIKGKLKLLKFRAGNILPSVMYVEKQEDGSVKEIVGKAAINKGVADPDNCISSSKTYIGLTGPNKKTWKCQGVTYTPTDVATKILKEVHNNVRKIYDLAEEDVVQAVITIPAYFTSTQSEETKRAGERAGMEVLQIIPEPVAAAISAAEDIEGKIFIIDLGGGTFDVSVLDVQEQGQQYTTLKIDGERRLGGDDFDEILTNYFLNVIGNDIEKDLSSLETSGMDYNQYYLMMSKVRSEATSVKEELSDSDEAEAYLPKLEYSDQNGEKKTYDFEMTISRDEFDDLCEPLYRRIMQVIDRTVKTSNKFTKEELQKIYLVGGSCYIPKIQEKVEEYFGLAADSEQDRATQVAMGAGKYASGWNGLTTDENRVDPFGVKLQDIISHDMGVAIRGDYMEKEFSRLLKAGESYPCVVKKKYRTSQDNQQSVLIEVYEKTELEASDFIEKNEKAYDLYGSFELTGIKPAPAGATPIEVTFDYDKSRILQVTARDLKNQVEKTVELHKGDNWVDEESNVKPTDFYLLIDVSGSMRGEKIEAAKQASVKLIEDTLDLSVHRLGIITFGDRITTLCQLTQNRNQLLRAVDGVKTYGGTTMDRAIQRAGEEFEADKLNNKAIIIVTDGAPNSKSATEREAKKIKEDGVSIATIGVQGADMHFLKQLTQKEELNFAVNNIAKLADIFGQAVANLLKR